MPPSYDFLVIFSSSGGDTAGDGEGLEPEGNILPLARRCLSS
jgi:hypothetical protein